LGNTVNSCIALAVRVDEAKRVLRLPRPGRLPISRLGTVTDIAKGIVFLASDDAGFMTGAGLVVDGGTTAQ
jgi:NAD(P)-dependent dehydrogenase (short-subunit alcohol dehydrogenase family)